MYPFSGKCQKGFTLTEVVIVLVIASILTVYLSRTIETRQTGVAGEVQTLYKTMQAARAKAVSGQHNVRIEFENDRKLRIVSETNSGQEVQGPWINLKHIAIQQRDTKVYAADSKPATIYWGKNGEMPAVAEATTNATVAAELMKKVYFPVFDTTAQTATNKPTFLTFIRVHGTGNVDMVKDFITPLPPK